MKFVSHSTWLPENFSISMDILAWLWWFFNLTIFNRQNNLLNFSPFYFQLIEANYADLLNQTGVKHRSCFYFLHLTLHIFFALNKFEVSISQHSLLYHLDQKYSKCINVGWITQISTTPDRDMPYFKLLYYESHGPFGTPYPGILDQERLSDSCKYR